MLIHILEIDESRKETSLKFNLTGVGCPVGLLLTVLKSECSCLWLQISPLCPAERSEALVQIQAGICDAFFPNFSVEDLVYWRLPVGGKFTVKSAWNHIGQIQT